MVCIVKCIGMYWHGMSCSMYWYVLFLICIASIGVYWCVLTFDLCRYWYVFIYIRMFCTYGNMVCIVRIDGYSSSSVSTCINVYVHVLLVLLRIYVYCTSGA